MQCTDKLFHTVQSSPVDKYRDIGLHVGTTRYSQSTSSWMEIQYFPVMHFQ